MLSANSQASGQCRRPGRRSQVAAARLESARLQGCKVAGDRLCTARLQAPGLQSGGATQLHFAMQQTLHLSRANPCKEQNLRYI